MATNTCVANWMSGRLYHRNPQTFVPNIFRASQLTTKKVQRIHVAPGQESFIEMPLVR
jgi:hypothetical protein